ncbi:MAG: DctP family TRAP transporter solute-binding subunit [Proteobacteria bacterium]|nr:DctP family TRAP transporter solute-binding subunit [Pseudomonadota bacterium]
MKKRNVIIALLAVLLAIPIAVSAGPIQLTVAEIHPKDYPTTQGLFKFAELVKQRSAGQILIDVKYGGQLGKGEKKVVEQVQFGALDMARISVSPMTEFVPALEAFGLPYIWKSQQSMWKVLNGEIGKRLLKAVEKYRFYGLNYYEAGARSFYNSKREIKTVADLKGLKIRVQKSQLMLDLVNTMGANATPIAFGEVYDAISKGVIDGAENNWPSYESTGHYEVAKYYTLDTHTRVPEITVASRISFDKKLTKEQIELVKKAALDTQSYVVEKWNQRVGASKKKVMASGKNIITELTPEAREGFVKAVQPLYDKYGEKHKAIIKEIRTAQ